MDVPTADAMRALMERRVEPSVTIALPTRRDAVRIAEQQISLKNLIAEADDRLAARGAPLREARRLLDPARELVADALFWRHQLDGLVIFATPDSFEYLRVPCAVRPLAFVGSRLHTRRLLPLLSARERFFVLLLQKSRVRLFTGSRFSFEEVDLQGAPQRLAALLESTIEIAANMHFHSVGHGESASQTTIVHASGSPSGGPAAESKLRALEFYELIDPVLHDYLRDEKAPLVLAGVDRLIPLYLEANTYPHVAPEAIQHGVDHADEQFIHGEALRIVEPIFAEAATARAGLLSEARAAGRMSDDVPEIVDAAIAGRVDTLFVSLDAECWGRVGDGDAETVVHAEREDPDDDLLDVAAAETVLRGGAVFPLGDGELRELSIDAPAAALFRY